MAAQELKQTPEALRARLADNGGLERIQTRLRQDAVIQFLLSGSGAGAETKEPS